MFEKLKQWLKIQWAYLVLESANVCPKHLVTCKFDRWIGNYCPECFSEKWGKRLAKEKAQEAALAADVKRATQIVREGSTR